MSDGIDLLILGWLSGKLTSDDSLLDCEIEAVDKAARSVIVRSRGRAGRAPRRLRICVDDVSAEVPQ